MGHKQTQKAASYVFSYGKMTWEWVSLPSLEEWYIWALRSQSASWVLSFKVDVCIFNSFSTLTLRCVTCVTVSLKIVFEDPSITSAHDTAKSTFFSRTLGFQHFTDLSISVARHCPFSFYIFSLYWSHQRQRYFRVAQSEVLS